MNAIMNERVYDRTNARFPLIRRVKPKEKS